MRVFWVIFVAATAASPAFAGTPVPAPVAGVGIVAFVALGIGYRAIKRRIDR